MIKWIKQYNNNALQLVVFLLFTFPLFTHPTPIIFIILVGLLSLFFHKEIIKQNRFFLAITLAFPSLYLLQYWMDPSYESWFVFEKKIALIAVPLIFANLKSHSINYKLPLIAFTSATTLLAIIGLGYLGIQGVNSEYLTGGVSFAVRNTLESILHIHPTYLSLFVSFSTAILISILIKFRQKKNSLWLIIGIVLHLAFVLVLASRIAFIGLFVIFIFMTIHHRTVLKPYLKYISLSLVLIIGASWFIPSSKERIKELVTTLYSETPQQTNSTNIRQSIYYCSSLLLEQNWATGIGTSKLQDHLNTCYYMIGSVDIIENNYNTHNEYLNIWLGLGLIGIVVYLILILGSFYYAKGNDIHLVFLLLFSLFCITENLLERQSGVLFFTIWNSYFIWNRNNNNEEEIR